MTLINRLKENYLIAIILFIATVLRIYHLDFQSPWLDEIYTLTEANPDLSLAEMNKMLVISEQTPPLYFLIMRFLFMVFGHSILVMRTFSALVGVTGIYIAYRLGKELHSSKAGIYAAALLAINYFHLYYSQEGRVYALLFLFSSLSFYYLVRFIKMPSAKAALLYGISSALMVAFHLFGLFSLVGQYVLLLFFVIAPYGTTRKNFIKYCLLSAVSTLIIFLPATYSVLTKSADIKKTWLPMPEPDAYTQIFKDFFGNSELVVFFVLLPIAIFFIQLFKQKEAETGTAKFKVDPVNDKLTFSFLILFTWILVTLLLPLIRSYTAIPILVNRYFMLILPAVMLVISIGLSYIRNHIVRYALLIIIVVFSLTDLFVVKKYYTTVTKTQFREASEFIIRNNTAHEPVVSSMSWYFPFFFKDVTPKMKIIDKTLNDYVLEMIKDSTKRKPFWYADAHGRTYNVTEAVQKFLDTNFVLGNTLAANNAWVHHYTKISNDITEVDISKFQPLKIQNGEYSPFYFDSFKADDNTLKMAGWAYFKDQDATDTELDILIISKGRAYKVQHQRVDRNDVAEYYGIPYDLTDCGFKVSILTTKIPPGRYRVAILLKNKKTNRESLTQSDHFFTKK